MRDDALADAWPDNGTILVAKNFQV